MDWSVGIFSGIMLVVGSVACETAYICNFLLRREAVYGQPDCMLSMQWRVVQLYAFVRATRTTKIPLPPFSWPRYVRRQRPPFNEL